LFIGQAHVFPTMSETPDTQPLTKYERKNTA
jgi:hypothetical protein